ncbi:O-methyltransferase clustered with LanBC [Alloactinosynnema sp. L-07]|uniref:thiopeptide-type bacteriocin biosynthesis protein n=1 Tax=Alloactinosynnema sp. L-07 TaxID=1653480 RepID=UPI00065F012B|nr:thiopeptide-type bacteriocin biosynthesis protein [Alloactinosynnema sp. L-07]CRK57673.1 O-methyltransferase clustered with LanBC [Alloactinosynnema sp. L-07]
MSQAWRQVLIHFDTWDTAEHTAVTELAPMLAQTEASGRIVSWFFVRKAPCWRLRFLPADDATTEAAAFIHHRLDALHAAGRIARWVETIYEPETHAFGGPQAMDTAHTLFHQDSHHILQHLATTAGGGDKRRELAVLLCCAMMRAAGLDWHEQGDVWARVAEHRSLPPDTPPDRLYALQPGLRRLLTVNTTPLTQDNEPLAFLADWQAAFTNAGTNLGDMARDGVLQRGLRAVLAQHVIFAWNRIGLPHTTQSLLAHVAKAAVFDQ